MKYHAAAKAALLGACALMLSSIQLNAQTLLGAFRATLDRAQEVAPGGTGDPDEPGSGYARMQLFENADSSVQLDFELTFSPDVNFGNVGGSDNGGSAIATLLHFHSGERGVNGGVLFGIFGPDQDDDGDTMFTLNGDMSTTITGSWDEDDTSANAAINTLLATFDVPPGFDVPIYFNLHTEANGAGSLRGQIVAVPEPSTLIGLASLGVIAVSVALRFRRRR